MRSKLNIELFDKDGQPVLVHKNVTLTCRDGIWELGLTVIPTPAIKAELAESLTTLRKISRGHNDV